MKHLNKIAMLVLALLMAGVASARDGYKITLKFTDVKDSVVYLAHYFGKPLPTIYKSDSARFDKNGVAVIESNEKTLGGIYIILLSDKKTYFEFLLDNGDEMTITATASKLPDGLVYKNSPENERFLEYVRFLKDFGGRQQALAEEMANAKNSIDSAATRQRMINEGQKLVQYRADYIKKYPNTLMTNIFRALETPVVPEGVHHKPDGSVDSNFAYNYYKAHYWDGFDFTDDRLIHTPLYDGKLDEYFNKLVIPVPDSVTKEADILLKKTRGRPELFRYTLWWVTRNAEESKIMGMDKAFVHFVEQYYLRGDAYWLADSVIEKYRQRISNIAPNMIGNKAPEIRMVEKGTKKPVALSDIKAKYTLVVFYDPTCGHCQHEVPALDSVYQASLKAKGVKVLSIRTEGPMDKWDEFIKKHKFEGWIHAYDPERQSDYRSKYDVYSTPVIYLLDERKIIQGKRLDHTNVLSVIEMLEAREKQAQNSTRDKS
jgi:peroxiredoxin